MRMIDHRAEIFFKNDKYKTLVIFELIPEGKRTALTCSRAISSFHCNEDDG